MFLRYRSVHYVRLFSCLSKASLDHTNISQSKKIETRNLGFDRLTCVNLQVLSKWRLWPEAPKPFLPRLHTAYSTLSSTVCSRNVLVDRPALQLHSWNAFLDPVKIYEL